MPRLRDFDRRTAWHYCIAECRRFRLGCAVKCELRHLYRLPPHGEYPFEPVKTWTFQFLHELELEWVNKTQRHKRDIK